MQGYANGKKESTKFTSGLAVSKLTYMRERDVELITDSSLNIPLSVKM